MEINKEAVGTKGGHQERLPGRGVTKMNPKVPARDRKGHRV